MVSFGHGVATPMLSSISSKNCKYYGPNSVGIDIMRILKIFGFLKSAAQTAQKCPKPLLSILFFKKSGTLTIDRNV